MADTFGNLAATGMLFRTASRLHGVRVALVVTVLFAAAFIMAKIVQSAGDSRVLLACLAASAGLLACSSILARFWRASPYERPAVCADAICLLAVALLPPVAIIDSWSYTQLTMAVLVAAAGASAWIARVVSGEAHIRIETLNVGAVLAVGTCLAVGALWRVDGLSAFESAAGPIALAGAAPLFSAGASSRHPLSIALGVSAASVVVLALSITPDHELLLTICGMLVVGGLVATRTSPAVNGPRLELGATRHRPWLPVVSLIALVALVIGLDASWRWLALVSFATVAAATIAAQGVDLAVRERLLDRLTHLARLTARQARLDPLTRLPNRAALDARLNEEVERAIRYRHPTAILFIDVDHFKSINDIQGHEAGDRALRAIGETIRATIRTPDFVARFGGEEFVVIAPGTWSIDATVLGQRIQIAIGESIRHGDGGPVTVSVGIAGVPEHAGAPDEVLRVADQALYRAKHAGRNRVEIAAMPPVQDLRDNS